MTQLFAVRGTKHHAESVQSTASNLHISPTCETVNRLDRGKEQLVLGVPAGALAGVERVHHYA